jgi:hypothetical protein
LGDCCFADQLIGQNMATVAGLGDLLDPEHIRIALKSIWQYNRRQDLAHYASVQRVYALNDEAAIINCDYRKGTRPEVPMPYYSENWTGLEHSLAALMISHGMVAEGVEIIENVRRRYDGEKANPYDESEYGRHYARAMASWAAVPMLSGFQFNARSGRMELAPRVSERDFRCFWSAASGWGSFELSAHGLSLEVVAGSVSLKELMLAPFAAGANLRVTSGELEVEHRASAEGSGVVVRFPKAVTVDAKQPLRVRTV